MTESLHKIIKNYVHHWTADDICQDITGWLLRNYEHDWKYRDTINRVCEDIWESCEEADRAL